MRLQNEHSFTGSYETVKDYVRAYKKKLGTERTQGYLPLCQLKGHAQVDFGQFKYYDPSGGEHTGHALTLSFPYSNAAFTQVFPSENQECLLEGLKRIFNYVGGVPVRIKADNMTTAVAHVLKDGGRVLAEGFTRFMLHYRFQPEFCNLSAGWEKGSVEGKVGYSRRNFFVPVPVIDDFEQYNHHLFQKCVDDRMRSHYKHSKLINDLWDEEKIELLTLPCNEYEIFRYETARINNYGCVTVDTNHYGASPELSGKLAMLKIYYDKIEIRFENELLKTYARSYERNKEYMDWKQYIGLMEKKPGGIVHARFFNQLPALWQEYIKASNRQEKKSALMLLQEIVNDGNVELCDEAISFAQECGRTDVESIRQCYYMISRTEYRPNPVSLSALVPAVGFSPNLDAYDHLTGGWFNGQYD